MASTKCVVSQGVAAMRREIQANAKQGLLCGTCNQKTDRVFTYDRKLLDGLAYKPKFGTNVLTSHAIDPLPEKYYPRVKMASYTADDEIDWLKGGEAGRMLVKGTWKQPLIVVFKPAGVKMTGDGDSIESKIKHILRVEGRRETVTFPYRLDRGASGLLPVALQPWALAEAKQDIEGNKWQKRFRVLVDVPPCVDNAGQAGCECLKGSAALGGDLPFQNGELLQEGVMESDIMPLQSTNPRPSAKLPRFSVTDAPEFAKPAKTYFNLVQVSPSRNFALYDVEIPLEPATPHQIRVHFAEAGLPLVGDSLYNPRDVCRDDNKEATRLFSTPRRLGLQAYSLEYEWKKKKNSMWLEMPQDWRSFMLQ